MDATNDGDDLPEHRSRLVLLGTAGGPRISTERSSPAQAVIADDRTYLVDCGHGALRQLLAAGRSQTDLEHVFITHHHSDHNLDLATLIVLTWAAGRTRPLHVWGPPPLEQIVAAVLKAHDYDISVRTPDEGRPPLEDLVAVHEIDGPGHVMRDDHVRVSCAVVNHPPVEPALAFRLDTAERSFVISGDTTPCDALVDLAAGADVLVHEALHAPSVPTILKAFPYEDTRLLQRHILGSHTTTDQVGHVARRAEVATLVLSHLVPTTPMLTAAQWLEEPTSAFSGAVILGQDLMTI